MATISPINIKLGVQTQGLTTGFATASSSVRRFDAQVNATSGGMSKMGAVGGQLSSGLSSLSTKFAAVATGALAAAAAFAALTVGIQGIKTSFVEIDRVANLADATEFSFNFIRGLEYAADQAGSSTEAIGKGLQKFSRMLGEAEGGSKSAIEAFAGLGLSVDQLTTMSPEEAFLATADALSQLPEAGEKAAKAFAIFGRQGQELINVLNQGKAGLEGLMAQADRVRGTLTPEKSKGVQDAMDAGARMLGSLQGIADQVAAILAPALESGANELTEFFVSLRLEIEASAGPMAEFGENLAMTAVSMVKLAPAIATVADNIVGFTQFVRNLDAAQVRVNLSVLAGVAAFGAAIVIIPKIIAGVQLFIGALRALASAQAIATAFGGPKGWAVLAGAAVAAGVAVAGVSLAFDSLDADVESAGMAASEVAAATKVASQSFDDLGESAAVAGTKVDDAAKKMEAMHKAGQQLTDSLRTPFEVIADHLAHAQELMQQGVISWETYMRAIGKADEALAELNKTKNDLGTETNVGFVDRNTQAGYAAMFGKTENAGDKIVDAITAGDAAIVATLQQVITAAKEGGVTILKRTLD